MLRVKLQMDTSDEQILTEREQNLPSAVKNKFKHRPRRRRRMVQSIC